jgi:hypothetical protein
MRLSGYIKNLIDALGAENPAALARMRTIVGSRKARIIVDRERADVWFSRGRLRVLGSSAKRAVDGNGQTDSRTVLDLLNGYLEVNEAILSGRLEVSGNATDVSRMFMAIDILLDASSRSPALQELARRFEAEHETRTARWIDPSQARGYNLFANRDEHRRLLARLDLLS